MAEIYALTDPKDGAVRYIGKANDSQKRFKGHLRDVSRRDTPVYHWMRELREEGLQPGLRVLESCVDWQEAERRLIAEHRAQGSILLNVAEGGKEPFCSQEVRAKNGRHVAATRNKRFWKLKQALGLAIKQGHLRPETHARLVAAGIF